MIGRSPYCSVVISSDRVSREHARIVRRGIKLTVEDLGSANGTKVNGEKIKDMTELNAGDVIGIGEEHLEITKAPSGPKPGSQTVQS